MRTEAQRVFSARTIWAAASLLCLAAAPIRAETAKRVIELFTSQGCPKCPPADRLIAEFAKEPDTIALSFAVNYWDFVGWKDTLASPVFTARQHAYAASRGDRRIFTPQAIVDGRGVQPGADKAAILRDAGIILERDGALRVPISLEERGGRLEVHVGAGALEGPAAVYVLRVVRSKTVEIGRGENSGRSVTYANAVRAMTKLGDWKGAAADYSMIELKGDDEGYVVLLQAGPPERPGTILAAAKTQDL